MHKSTLAAAGTIGIFSWPSVTNSFWIAQALWYISLILSIWALILSAQQHTLLETLPSPLSEKNLQQTLNMILHRRRAGTEARVDWNVVYINQNPTMLMSYSWVFFMIALTLYVSGPLIDRDPWGDQSKVRHHFVFFVVFLAFTN
jgi:hypothetical protein